MVAMAVTTSALSFFVTPVCDDLGIGRGSFALYYSLMTATGTVSTSFLGQYINKKGVRLPLLISSLWCAGGLVIFSFANSLGQFCLAGAAIGIFGTGCMNLCANVIVQTAYSGRRATTVLGFVMAGSGVGGMVFSLVLPGILENYGWRAGFRFLALAWLILVLAGRALSGRQKAAGSPEKAGEPSANLTRGQILRSSQFYLMAAAVILYSVGTGIQQQLPALLAGLEFSPARVGTMMSVMTASLALGKIAQGLLYGKMGIARGGAVTTGLFIAGFFLLLGPQTAWLGLVSLAVGMGIVTTLMPTATRFLFGAREFAAVWGILAAASNAGALISTPVWGAVYDVWGSYTPAMAAVPALVALAYLAMLLALRKNSKHRSS